MDDIYTRIGSVASPLRYLVSKAFYVGGIAHQGRTLALENEVSFDRWNRSTEQFNQQASSMSRNFYGCLRKVNRINFFFFLGTSNSFLRMRTTSECLFLFSLLFHNDSREAIYRWQGRRLKQSVANHYLFFSHSTIIPIIKLIG